MRMPFAIFFILLSGTFFAQISLVKGPYLQIGTHNSMIIKWETNIASDSKVMYGTGSSALSFFTGNGLQVTSHEIFLSGLNPATKYFYSIGTSTSTIQGDTNNYFVTSPLPGTPGKYRFWITGDMGNGSAAQLDVKNAYLNYVQNRVTNGWLLLGDNVYDNGTDAEFNTKFFNVYQPDIMRKTVLWPAPGNHDYANNFSNQQTHNIPYYSIFTVPSGGEAGGVWSGTEAFYSYNVGNIHFIALDSYGFEFNTYRLYDTLGPQVSWLKQDLAANDKLWTVVYWHHPPYTMGSHNSDTEGELDSIRKNLVRILERNKVDLVMCGHSHSYERSKLMQGHFGYEPSFNAGLHHLSSSSAVYDGSADSCPYIKDSLNTKGTVYVVAGSAGQLGGQQGAWPHNAMFFSNESVAGSLVLEFNENRLDAKWVCADDTLRDRFSIFKNVNAVKQLTVNPAQSLTLTASWPGTHVWSSKPDTLRSIVITPAADTTYWVKDAFNCLADTFKIKIVEVGMEETQFYSGLKIYPNPFSNETILSFNLKSVVKSALLQLTDVLGRRYPVFILRDLSAGQHEIRINADELRIGSGIYQLSLQAEGLVIRKNIILSK